MYTMRADGVLFHNPGSTSTAYQAIGGRGTFELDKAEALTFTLPPDNVVYNSLQKRKTIVTLEENGTELFRGRVMEIIRDTFNMLEVYCEGELSLLKDSLQPPVEFEGSALEYLSMAIANHNAQMESDKQFSLGSVSALTDDYTVNVKTTEYRETLGDIRSLLMSEYGGHLIVRYSGGTRYLDYVKEYTGTSSGKVQFGVNLIEYENRMDASNAFSMLVPLGAVVDKQRLTVESVNGSIYLTDSTALTKYGRIIKTKTFDGVEDPAELLRLGQEYMKNALNVRTITVKAIDMGVLGGGIIRIGEQALISSSPHGINEYEMCSKIELDIDNPEQSEFTFGKKPETLTGKMAQQQEKDDSMWHKLFDWLTVTDTELILAKQHISEQGDIISNVLFKMDALNANIQLKADQTVITELDTRLSTAEILIDGANAAIDLKADRTTVSELETRMTAAEILIDGANAEIALKAAQKDVDAMGERLSSAEIRINGAESAVEVLAEEIRLAGYVTADALETEVIKVVNSATADSIKTGALNVSGTATVSTLYATGAVINSLNVPNIIIGGTPFVPSDYATKEWVEEQGYLKSAGTFATQSWVIEQGYVTSSDVAETLTNFVMRAELDDYATQAWVEAQGYLTEIPTGYATEAWVAENFSKASATYKPTSIERYGSVSGTSIPVQALNEAGTVLLTGTVDAGDVYSSGYSSGASSVTLSKGGWYGGNCTVTASNGKTATVSLPSFSVSGGTTWSSNKTTVYFSTSSVSGYLASKTVDATSVYNNGWNDCRDACASAEVYTISEYAPGTLYVKVGDYYSSAGSSWVKVTRKYGVYTLPSAKG